MVGVDIIDINRFKQVVIRTPRLLNRVFTSAEIEYCQNKKNPYPYMAVRFAAKEAVRKIDRLMIKGVKFKEIEVVLDAYGKPELVLHGQARQNSLALQVRKIYLSLSHDGNQAIAFAYMQKG